MKVKTLIKIVLFILFIVLVTWGRTVDGAQGLGIQSIGLFGLLGLLYSYNQRYQ